MNYMDYEELKKLNGESEYAYIFRVCSKKNTIGTWQDVADILNKELGYEYGESKYRKSFQSFENMMNENQDKFYSANGYLAEIVHQKHELEIEKIKVRDERIDYQKSIREGARKKSFLEAIERCFEKVVTPLNYINSPMVSSDDDMIVCLSDLHAGIEINNWWNSFNETVLRQRLRKYLDEIIDVQMHVPCKECLIVLPGDNISGIIHTNMRLQNNENVIEQIKIATELIAEFISVLQIYFEKIKVYSVAGNHSRISPNKEDHLKGEELDELITYCLELKFSKNGNVEICKDSRIDNTIGCFKTRGGKQFFIVHGDKDSPSNVVKNLSLMVGIKPDGIIMGHRHHTAYNSEHGVKVIQCGSLLGSDDYCVDKRISGLAEQCIIITNEQKTVKCFYDVCLQ